MLDSDRPLSELLLDIVVQARQLLGSDGARLFRLETADEAAEHPGDGRARPRSAPRRAAAAAAGERSRRASPRGAAGGGGDRPRSRRRPTSTDDGGRAGRRPDCRACLAVPLVVRDEVYGVIALYYDARHDVRRPGRRAGGVVRRPGGPGHRERAAARTDGAERRGRRALAPRPRAARLGDAVAVRAPASRPRPCCKIRTRPRRGRAEPARRAAAHAGRSRRDAHPAARDAPGRPGAVVARRPAGARRAGRRGAHTHGDRAERRRRPAAAARRRDDRALPHRPGGDEQHGAPRPGPHGRG